MRPIELLRADIMTVEADAVVNVFSAREDRSAVLASAYRRSLEVAGALGAASVVFPAISAGVYGWPAASAARIAVDTVSESPYEGGCRSRSSATACSTSSARRSGSRGRGAHGSR